MTTDYVAVTEVAGDEVTQEQVDRLARRYFWAAEYCRGKDVLEVGCGTGQGVGYLGAVANNMMAGDLSTPLLSAARRHYGTRFDFREFDAQDMPFGDASFDVVLLFEAIYYLPDADEFFAECRRILRPGGQLLIVTANKDLFDFNPSPYSYRYFGIKELDEALKGYGFSCAFFGDTPVESVSLRQRILRPVKAVAGKLGLIPRSMRAKKLLKRLVFGRLVIMPAEISDETALKILPASLTPGIPDTDHKVIYCAACKD